METCIKPAMVKKKNMKTAATNEILEYIKSKFEIHNSQFVNFWDADNCAFGINNLDKSILIYISTFDKNENNYYLEIEYTNRENEIYVNINRQNLKKKLQNIL